MPLQRLFGLEPQVLDSIEWPWQKTAIFSSELRNSGDLDIISAAINTARKDWGIHMDNPILSMRRPKPSKARERRLILDEEQRLLAALDNEERDDHGRLASGTRNPWIKPLVRLATETAMRRGELLSLTWDNIDLGEQTAYLPDTKNGTSRSVPLSMTAVALLRALPPEFRSSELKIAVFCHGHSMESRTWGSRPKSRCSGTC